MQELDQNQIRDMLLKSLFDFHYANEGASYILPKAMVDADVNSKEAIEYLVEKEFAADSGEGTENLVLAITPKGIEYINSK